MQQGVMQRGYMGTDFYIEMGTPVSVVATDSEGKTEVKMFESERTFLVPASHVLVVNGATT